MSAVDPPIQPTDETPKVGDLWDSRYRLDRELGRGGGGIVFAATHLVLGNQVAIKIVPGISGQRAQRRLVREASALAQLRDPRVVTMRDVGVASGGMYLVMDYLEGNSLYEFISNNGPLPVGVASWVVREVALAVASLHSFQFIHRDIKPGNIFLVRRGGVVMVQLIDLGLVRIASESQDSALTVPLSLLGTIPYIAPEQIAQPSAVGTSADIWSLGIVLHELCTGQLPFRATSRQDWLREIVQDDLPLSDSLPDSLVSVVKACLMLQPQERVQSATELAALLEPMCEIRAPEMLLSSLGVSQSPATKSSDDQFISIEPAAPTQSEVGEGLLTQSAAVSALVRRDGAFQKIQEELVGEVAGRQYVIGKLLGEGGTGTVFSATDDLGFDCAIKMLSGSGPRAQKRAMREAVAARSIRSPYVVSVLDVGMRQTGEPFLVMELLQGDDLRTIIAEYAPLSADVVMDILMAILLGLQQIHQARLWHRDIKPSNVFLVRQNDPSTGDEIFLVKLCDLGLARAHDDGANADTTLGTPGYTAPEILRGEPPSESTELYGAFVTAYEAISKRLPWQGQRLVPLKQAAPWVPDAIASVIDRGVMQDPAVRWQSVDAALNAVRCWAKLGKISPERLRNQSPSPNVRRSTKPFMYMLAAAMVGPALWALSWVGQRGDRQQPSAYAIQSAESNPSTLPNFEASSDIVPQPPPRSSQQAIVSLSEMSSHPLGALSAAPRVSLSNDAVTIPKTAVVVSTTSTSKASPMNSAVKPSSSAKTGLQLEEWKGK